MNKLLVGFLMLLLLAILGGGVFLSVWDIPPPAQEVERPIDVPTRP